MAVKSSRVLRVVLVLGVVGALGLVWLGVNAARAKATDDAAREAARAYVDLIATGDAGDLERLWELTVSESPGALRTAGEVLADAEERIEVLSVGEPKESAPIDVPHEVDFDRFVQVFVRYRLDGEDHERPVGLGRIEGEDGADVSDWRVALPLTSEIGWSQPGFADVARDVFVSGVRQVRRPLLLSSDETAQPLYPAVYRTQSRLDPWFASRTELVTVVAGVTSLPPDYRLDPTTKTQERIRGQVVEAFADCGTDDLSLDCPVDELVEGFGVDTYRPGWWLGFTEDPEIRVDHADVTISGGVFRYRERGGDVREVRFRGTCSYFIDNQSWTPVLAAYECRAQEVAR